MSSRTTPAINTVSPITTTNNSFNNSSYDSNATNLKLRPSPRDTTNVHRTRSGNSTSSNNMGGNNNTNNITNNNSLDCASSVASDSVYSAVSVTSSYRHHHTGPFVPPPRVSEPQPVLVKDAQYQPKTHGSLGILIVGLGGANGTTLLAGVLANRHKINWYGPRGEPMEPNYYGCITQIPPRGVHGGVGYQGRIRGLANVSMAAIGGWDIRPTKLGDALLEAQILDYDLVRQVRDEMNKVKVFRGVYDDRFIGSSQHATATHVLTKNEATSDSEALKCLRADIRYFKWRNGVVGHTTVIWSASVEPNCELLTDLKTAADLLDTIEMSEEERGGPLPPSLLYATAALLEGCSFMNGGSQNTLSCPGLHDLAQQQLGIYCLGTDFKAGQTKFKTAAVEYLRTMGLKPRVIASSNHLGNNDMRNLASSKTTSVAKLRVKHDIFAPWQEDELDHKVCIMFTEFINDEKRDFVEYTSLGFLGQTHTMVTYTRASDSVLCVPLMIDGAVWCDFFSSRSWSYERVAKALAYLFKVPEGAAKGVDPGFFRQMQELESQVLAAADPSGKGHSKQNQSQDSFNKKRVRIRPDEKATEWAIPHDARIICAGLACLDMQLNQATDGGGENIETFEGEQSIGGGSVAMACKTLARLVHGAPLDDGYMQVTPPVVHSVVPLCKIGTDSAGEKLLTLLEGCGEACRNVEVKYTKNFRNKDPNARTALSVLPIYKDGRRGCFFDAASNATFSARELVAMMSSLSSGASGPALDLSHMSYDDVENYRADLEQMTPIYGAFLFGYPHLMPLLQGESLAQVLLEARSCMIEGGIVAVDLNGVPEQIFKRKSGFRSASDLKNDAVLGAALDHIDILHMNEDELELLTGCKISGVDDEEDDFAIANATELFLHCGVAIVIVTRGKRGSFVTCNDLDRFRRSAMLPASWVDCTARVSAVKLPKETPLNTNGAGDAFTAGFLVGAMLRHTGMTVSSSNEVNINTKNEEKPPEPKARAPTRSKTPKKKLTPYTLYMRENYVSLKKRCNDDKKAVFSMCHEMWENENDDVKALYDRKAMEENEQDDDTDHDEMSMRVMDDIENMDTVHMHHNNDHQNDDDMPRNMYMTNRSLNLESAVQLATLIAAYHIDVNTRDRLYLDLNPLLDKAMVFPAGLEEI